MAAKKRGSGKAKRRTRTATARSRKPAGGAKFAGTVVMTPPGGGRRRAVSNGTHVVASIAELSVARLPEGAPRAELQLDVVTRTTSSDGAPVVGSWSSGVYYYVAHGSRLNIDHTVVFDAVVNQHVSFDVSLVEREMPQLKTEDAAALAGVAAEAAAELAGASGLLGNALEAFPGVLAGILRLQGDDQVLRHSTSLFTREVGMPERSPNHLLEGRYRFEKRRTGRAGDPWVTLVLDIRTVG